MVANILNGQAIAQEIRNNLANEIKDREKLGLRKPGLAVILLGNDPASTIYVNNKEQAAKEIGMLSKSLHLPSNTTETDLIKIINTLNIDPDIDGILVQLPLPEHINSKKILESISPNKDVDGFQKRQGTGRFP